MSAPTAGRELDAEVAEKVMGTVGIIAVTVIDHRGAHSEPGTRSAPYRMPDGRMGVQAERLPHYSTDIAAAWLVLAKLNLLRETGQVAGLESGLVLYQTRNDEWAVAYRHGLPIVRAATAPLAICLAALEARS